MTTASASRRHRLDGSVAFRLAAVSVVMAPVVLIVSFGVALSAAFCVDSDSDGCVSGSTATTVFVVGSVLVVVPFVIGVGRLIADVIRGRNAEPRQRHHDGTVNRKAVVAVVSALATAATGAMTSTTDVRPVALVLLVAPLALFAVVHGLRAITEVREAGQGARGGAAARWSIAVTVVTMTVLVLLPA